MGTRQAPEHLVDRWSAHLTFNGRAPATLEELMIARAEYEHRVRLAEIKAMRAKLALLEPFLPALAEQGIRLADRKIHTYDHGKTLRIPPPLFGDDSKLAAALLGQGFREIEREPYGHGRASLTLKHGRALLVKIDVREAPEGGAA